MKSKNIIEVTDFSQSEWIRLIQQAIKYKKNSHRTPNLLKRKRIGLVFDSNSLRTRLSFETATHLLGGTSYFIDVHNITHEKDGTKRESYEDIIDTMDRMIDVYVLRDYSQEMFAVFKRKSYPPFINGFCQVGHPSQALADLSVITWKKKRYNNLNYVGVCPAAGSGVMESFVYALLLLGQSITLITETGKFIGKNKDFHLQVKRLCAAHGGKFHSTKNIKEPVATADVLYVDEWWENTPNFLKRKIGVFKVNQKFLQNAKKDVAIMHCMPAHPGREISLEVMRSKQSIIYDQAEFRMYSAMALLSYLQR
ncbi:MAG: ornithine carbamoyltransferase [uncultured bacterium]|nr:MAG: ornithine carbamoyltransferase [uncultured bacterium]